MSITEVGRRLKKARQDAGLTQKEVATRLGITYQAISNYERGTNRVDTDTLTKLCAIYGIAISSLLTATMIPGEVPATDLLEEEPKKAPTLTEKDRCSDAVKSMNILRIAGRDGSYEERILTDEQLAALKAIIDQLPDASEDL